MHWLGRPIISEFAINFSDADRVCDLNGSATIGLTHPVIAHRYIMLMNDNVLPGHQCVAPAKAV